MGHMKTLDSLLKDNRKLEVGDQSQFIGYLNDFQINLAVIFYIHSKQKEGKTAAEIWNSLVRPGEEYLPPEEENGD